MRSYGTAGKKGSPKRKNPSDNSGDAFGLSGARVADKARKSRRIPNEIDDPDYLLMHPALCYAAGGGMPALVLARMCYWLSPDHNGVVRAQPQDGTQRYPSWRTQGLAWIAGQVGLDKTRANEKVIGRAIKTLETHDLIERLDAGRRGRLHLRICRDVWREWRRAGVIPPRGQQVKVWTADVREYGANEAILLGQLWFRCVLAKMTYRVKRRRDQTIWYPCSYGHLENQTGLTRPQLRIAIHGHQRDRARGLIHRGLIIAVTGKLGKRTTLMFRLTEKQRKAITRVRER